MKELKIYIAGPYTADSEEGKENNTNNSIDVGLEIYFRGHFPYIPHLTHWVDKRAKETHVNIKWEDYIRWDMEWLKLCDALLYLGKSKGADIELNAAIKMGKQIFYSINDIPILKRYDINK